MNATIQRLKPEEFPVLRSVYDGFCPDPKTSIALLAHDDGAIVGRVFLLTPAHVEGPWVREDYRGSLLGKRLMDGAEAEAKSAGVTTMFAYATSNQLASYLGRLGYEPCSMTVWKKVI